MATVWIYGEAVPETYRQALAAAGLETVVGSRTDTAADALLLPGGGDITGDRLETEEWQVIRRFVDTGRPILGICRGMQALNVFFGGTLYGHIDGHLRPLGDMIHPTCAVGTLAALLTTAPAVTSSHHQAVKRLGVELTVCQWASDGIVEGLCHNALPIIGVQYHPERQSFALRRPDAADGAPLFAWLRERIRKATMD